jgi:hypothetical protein
MRGWPRRLVLSVMLAAAMAACSTEKEPDENAIREAVERIHREYITEQRRNHATKTPELFQRLPNVNLAFEANLALRVTSVRKLHCQRATKVLGHMCRVVIGVSVAGRPPTLQNFEARFVRGTDGWQARDITLLEGSG